MEVRGIGSRKVSPGEWEALHLLGDVALPRGSLEACFRAIQCQERVRMAELLSMDPEAWLAWERGRCWPMWQVLCRGEALTLSP